MPNFDGLWEMRLFYTTTPTGFPALEHRLTLDLRVLEGNEPGDPPELFEVSPRVGAPLPFTDWVDDLLAGVVPLLASSTDITRAELWRADEASLDFLFYTVYDIGANGTSANPSLPAAQLTMTFRSALGGSGRFQLMESVVGGDSKTSFPTANAAANTLSAFIIAPASPILARDNAFFIGRINLCLGENEKIWRKRFRP